MMENAKNTKFSTVSFQGSEAQTSEPQGQSFSDFVRAEWARAKKAWADSREQSREVSRRIHRIADPVAAVLRRVAISIVVMGIMAHLAMPGSAYDQFFMTLFADTLKSIKMIFTGEWYLLIRNHSVISAVVCDTFYSIHRFLFGWLIDGVMNLI